MQTRPDVCSKRSKPPKVETPAAPACKLAAAARLAATLLHCPLQPAHLRCLKLLQPVAAHMPLLLLVRQQPLLLLLCLQPQKPTELLLRWHSPTMLSVYCHPA
jgi:hypothetical protein